MRRITRIWLVLGLAALTALAFAAAWTVRLGETPTDQPRSTHSSESRRPSSPPPPPPKLRPGPPVLAVKVDNVAAARPQVGVGAADQVYVEPVESGLSRMIAVYGEHRPPVVGPVRSARETDLELLPQYGSPTLAFSGAAPELLPMVERSPVRSASQERLPQAYFRDPARESPHNLMVRPAQLPEGGRWSPDARPRFGPPPAGGTPQRHHEVRYENELIGFDWSPGRGGWLVSMSGQPLSSADGGRLSASTVVVQHVRSTPSTFTDSLGNFSPYAHTVDSGRAVVLRDGQAHEARWSRPTPDSGTTYTTPSGDPLPFASGQVWTVLAPTGG